MACLWGRARVVRTQWLVWSKFKDTTFKHEYLSGNFDVFKTVLTSYRETEKLYNLRYGWFAVGPHIRSENSGKQRPVLYVLAVFVYGHL